MDADVVVLFSEMEAKERVVEDQQLRTLATAAP